MKIELLFIVAVIALVIVFVLYMTEIGYGRKLRAETKALQAEIERVRKDLEAAKMVIASYRGRSSYGMGVRSWDLPGLTGPDEEQ